MQKKIVAIVAGMLSGIVPGLGFLLARRWTPFISYFSAYVGIRCILHVIIPSDTVGPLVIDALVDLEVVIYIASIVHSLFIDSTISSASEVIRLVVIGAISYSLVLFSNPGKNMVICHGPSMEPSLLENFHVAYKAVDVIRRNDIALIKPNDEMLGKLREYNSIGAAHFEGTQDVLIKRIVAIAGDEVVIGNGRIQITYVDGGGNVINDSNVDESGDWLLKPGEVFALGDNTSDSLDSRKYGPVPESLIKGVVIKILLPVRFSKIIK